MTATAASACYRFGRFELQPDERRLLAAGTPVHVFPRAFHLLINLLEHSGHLVTKDNRCRVKDALTKDGHERQIIDDENRDSRRASDWPS